MFLVVYTSLSLRYKSKALGRKASRACFEKSDKKYFKKVLDKRNWMRYYIKADSHRALMKSLREGSVPWKLNNAKGNHAHMISSQMLEQHPRSESLAAKLIGECCPCQNIPRIEPARRRWLVDVDGWSDMEYVAKNIKTRFVRTKSEIPLHG